MVIRMRHTRSHSKNRRSHHALKAPSLAKCDHCGADRRPHHMCLECGYYKGRQVMDLEAKKTAREARRQAKLETINQQKAQMAEMATESAAPVENEESPKEEKK